MQLSRSSINQHASLYQFWWRSQGLWFSKLVKVTVCLLNEQELLAICQIHRLKQPKFGIRIGWEYYTKAESGQMLWYVDANQPGVVFSNKGVANDSQPDIYHYQMFSNHTLVTTNGKLAETTALEGDSRRLRDLRVEGKLIRRIWENKFNA